MVLQLMKHRETIRMLISTYYSTNHEPSTCWRLMMNIQQELLFLTLKQEKLKISLKNYK
jgi:hypothetical protein